MTITQIRPTSDDVKHNVGTTGGASAFSVLDDSPLNDSTQAQGTADRGYLYLGLPDNSPSLTATQRIKAVRAQLRISHDGVDVGHSEYVQMSFRDSSNGKYTSNDNPNSATVYSPGSFKQWVGQWHSSGPNGAAWTQALLNRLQLVIYWIQSSNGAGSFLRTSEAYVDVDVNERPTVNTVTVTGQSSTTRVTVTFAYSDTEDDPQTRYEIKVFTQAQTLVGGFDPATATPVYDSGVLVGNSTSHTLTADLVNGGTYIAYVAAAQDWSGPEGAQWWSNWSDASAKSSAFTIAITPPPTPTLTVTPNPTEPAYTQMLSIAAALNLLTYEQSTFEGGTVNGWAAVTNCAVANTNAFGADGTLSMRLRSSAAGTMTAEINTTIKCRPNKTVTAVGTVKSATASRTCRVGIRFYDINNAAIGTTVYGSTFASSTTVPTQGFVTTTAPANAANFHIGVEVQSTAAANEDHYWDKMGQWYGSSTVWSPGGMQGSATIVIERSKRFYFSRPAPKTIVHPQVYSLGVLTGYTNDFIFTRQANDEVRLLPLDRPSPEQPTGESSGMFEWIIRVGAFSYLDICYKDSVATDGTHPYLMPVVPGMSYTASCWLWASTPKTARLGIVWVDEANTTVGSVPLSSTANLTSTEQKVTVGGQAPAGSVYARLVVEDTSGTADFSMFGHAPRMALTADVGENWPGQLWFFNWETVRILSPANFSDGDTVRIHDHEYPPGHHVVYRARIVATNSAGLTVASANSTQQPAYMAPPSLSILKDPYQPENALQLYRDPEETESQTEDAMVFHAVGRDGDPLIKADWMGGQDGTLTVSQDTALALYRMRQLTPSQRSALLLQYADGGQKYIRIIGDRKTGRIRSYLSQVQLDYLEVNRP